MLIHHPLTLPVGSNISAWLKAVILSLIATAFSLPQISAGSEPYPSKPVVVKVAFPAGGGVDGVVRQILPSLQNSLGQPVVVENLPGVGGAIGAMNVARASSDGYTLLAHANDLILAPLVLASAQYKASDFRLITPLARGDFMLVARPGLAGKQLKDLIELSKSLQGGLSIAHQGLGSLSHLASEDFAQFAGMRITGVPYKGGAPIIQDLIGNHVDLAFLPVAANSVSMIKEGRIVAIGIASTQRNAEIPDVALLSEGRDRSFEYSSWTVIMAKRDIPESVAEKLNLAIRKALETPEFQKFAKDSAAKPFGMSLKEADAFYASAIKQYADTAVKFKLQPQ
ncbi:tripartite tricarboxylate transporter substrate binding protein [Variovorax ginsengisoli]|uniref:Tripartite tricarboxylate transporter substrate binding protein n=1 Tax=Variovorax ginsengisoli TaxID=363844 RepID=A0ABT8SCB6_9BURK|nr:tripartite tricarboxylate transporter substrate binding protein [Variovorax ginsengisoli]MDN8617392.1 tripartite tricarboxylate transporter substrate binding protein [Variovorax ginsengisoli]MDO1536562.1 tripartite tricarboxylate transporter substrate binding protein [Variovorax ginsengisoli]